MKKLSLFFLLMILFPFTYATEIQDDGLYFKKTISGDFSEITLRVKDALKTQGFSVITEIDMDKKLNEKLNIDVKPYKILGACNPGYAYQTLQIDDNIGVF